MDFAFRKCKASRSDPVSATGGGLILSAKSGKYEFFDVLPIAGKGRFVVVVVVAAERVEEKSQCGRVFVITGSLD